MLTMLFTNSVWERLVLFHIEAKGRISIQNADTMHKSLLYKTKTTQIKQQSKPTDNEYGYR